jgi:SAM-dependent methyltransferase
VALRERYDGIGSGYAGRRHPDPRIARAICEALDDADSVLNVGAGTGSYEPEDRRVVAVEPSRTMIAQRRRGSPPVLRGRAEALPVRTGSFDAALAVLTVHHWRDPEAGLAELRRAARRQVVFTFDPAAQLDLWFTRAYAPASAALEQERALPVARVAELLGAERVEPVLVPHDCVDGFLGAYWRRPHAYLDPAVRASISSLAQLAPRQIEPGLARLAGDLESGAWQERYGELLALESLDLGYRLVLAG